MTRLLCGLRKVDTDGSQSTDGVSDDFEGAAISEALTIRGIEITARVDAVDTDLTAQSLLVETSSLTSTELKSAVAVWREFSLATIAG